MKKMNRREFLTLTGASVALLALAACGGAPSTPVAPAGSKEAQGTGSHQKIPRSSRGEGTTRTG